jgi:acetyl esterase/lipase
MICNWRTKALAVALLLVGKQALAADSNPLCPSGSANILSEMTAQAPEGILGSTSYIYAANAKDPLRVYVFSPPDAKESDPRPAILFFYGGGWSLAPIRLYQHHATHFALRGMVAVLVDYRTKCRDGSSVLDSLADSRTAMRWVRANAVRLGIDAKRIAATGSSAGAFMAAALATNPDTEGAKDKALPSIRPQALFLIEPVDSAGELLANGGHRPLERGCCQRARHAITAAKRERRVATDYRLCRYRRPS